MKIKCMLDKRYYSEKPTGKDVGAIQNRITPMDITVEDLSNELIRGASFKAPSMNGRTDSSWVSQQLFALDFDEDTTIEEELNRCKELDILPVFGYTSFSHTKEQHKFRLVFMVDEVIKEWEDAKKMQTLLMRLFYKCDKQCSNLGRLYFGGKELIYTNYSNILDYKKLLTVHRDILYNNKLGRKGVPNKDNIYNINYIRYPKNPLTDNEDINYNIQAIKEHNIDTSKLYYI